MVVSSAKRVTIRQWGVPGMGRPVRVESHSIGASDSMARLKRRHDRGSPCCMP